MNKKAFLAIIGGVLSAGLICFVAGLIVYKTNIGNPVPVIISLFAMATGLIIAAVAAIVMIVTLIVTLINKSKNK